MKISTLKTFTVTIAICSIFFCLSANAQQYKTIADTAKLNKEYKDVVSDIIELNGKLTTAKNKTADYQSKKNDAAKDAESAAEASKEQAAKATDGNIKDIKKRVKESKKSQ